MEYLKETDRQYGFRRGRSCVTNLVSFYLRVVNVVQERDGWMECIYLDLKKVFDKVPHKRFLWKYDLTKRLLNKI